MPQARPNSNPMPKNQPLISASNAKASSIPSRTSRPLRYPRGLRVLFGPSELLQEPGPLVEPLHHLVVVQDLLAEHLVAILAERDLVANEPVLLEERPHPYVGEPQVVARDGRVGFLDAMGVERVPW